MQKFIRSFKYAFEGIAHCIKHEQNFKIHLVAAIMVIAAGCFLKCTSVEWIIILICIGLVLALEMMNSALEKLCDMQQTAYHPLIKIIKDTAAAAVLIMSVVAAICGTIIFLPKLLLLF
jgi:diacylglycerol kinase